MLVKPKKCLLYPENNKLIVLREPQREYWRQEEITWCVAYHVIYPRQYELWFDSQSCNTYAIYNSLESKLSVKKRTQNCWLLFALDADIHSMSLEVKGEQASIVGHPIQLVLYSFNQNSPKTVITFFSVSYWLANSVVQHQGSDHEDTS